MKHYMPCSIPGKHLSDNEFTLYIVTMATPWGKNVYEYEGGREGGREGGSKYHILQCLYETTDRKTIIRSATYQVELFLGHWL